MTETSREEHQLSFEECNLHVSIEPDGTVLVGFYDVASVCLVELDYYEMKEAWEFTERHSKEPA